MARHNRRRLVRHSNRRVTRLKRSLRCAAALSGSRADECIMEQTGGFGGPPGRGRSGRVCHTEEVPDAGGEGEVPDSRGEARTGLPTAGGSRLFEAAKVL